MTDAKTSSEDGLKQTTLDNSNITDQSDTSAKRKAESSAGNSPASKKGRKLEQQTLDDSLNDDTADERDVDEKKATKEKRNGHANEHKHEADEAETETNGKNDSEEKRSKDEPEDVKNGDGAVEEEKDKKLPSNILEKGIIYFFTRGRVGVDDIESVSDVARSYMVLRPLPDNAKLGDGAIQESKKNRLLAVPKKVLPKDHKDRFMVFVEKANVTMEELKDEFFQGSTYETKTSGVRSAPPVTPIGEGVYAITTEGRDTHLAYLLTIPSDIGEVQKDMGIREKASFLISLKNPTVKGPANATLPEGPGFPQEFIDEFSGRAWMPLSRTAHLEYPNAQFLLIGEGEQGFAKAVETDTKDKVDNDGAKEEIEELEHQDQIRVEHLHGDNTVFDDLGISKKDYPEVLTTW